MVKGQTGSSSGRKTTLQWMIDRGYEQVWKSALDPEKRRRFKAVRAVVERYGKDLEKKATELEKRARKLREAKAFYDESIANLDGMKNMMAGWGKEKPKP